MHPWYTAKNDNEDAQEIWDSYGVINDRYEHSDFGIHYSSSSLPLQNQFVVSIANPLFEMGVEKIIANPLLSWVMEQFLVVALHLVK